MIDLTAWSVELAALADRLRFLSADDLRADEALHELFAEAIHSYDVIDAVYVSIQDQTQYPPDWDHLDQAIEVDDPNILLSNMSGWVAVGRWINAPLADVHEKGWLEPAFRRLAGGVSGLQVRPGDMG